MYKFLFLILSVAVLFSSCGGTTVKVKQSSDGVNATVTVQTNNPTQVDVKPSVEVKLDDLTDLLNSVQDTVSFDENGEMILTSSDLIKLAKSFR